MIIPVKAAKIPQKEPLTQEKLLAMGMGETIYNGEYEITRVPGGWIYYRYDQMSFKEPTATATFVPEPPSK